MCVENEHWIIITKTMSNARRNVWKDIMRKRKTTDEFVAGARLLHKDKFNYKNGVYVNNYTKFPIECPYHGIFWQRPSDHLSGQGCPRCNGGLRLTLNEFITKSNEIHNENYKYDNITDYKNNQTKVPIECRIHGIFLQTPGNHLCGKGCPKCKNEKLKIIKQSNIFDFICKANVKHNYNYNYEKYVYVDAHTDGIVTCNACHRDFMQSPNIHLSGSGCPHCYGNLRLTKDEFVRRAMNTHGNYDYTNFNYINANTKGTMICSKNHIFEQTPSKHLQGQGCPLCKSSKGELKIISFLHTHKIEFKSQKTFDDCRNPKTCHKLKFDFYVPSKNLLIEYDGRQHFNVGLYSWNDTTLKYTQYNDWVKTYYAKKNNIDLLRISYMEFNNINWILHNRLT